MSASAVVIHSRADAEAALAAAETAGIPVRLISAPGAAAYVGPAWFREVVDLARARHPAVEAAADLDCGDRPGDAMAAFRFGGLGVIFRGREDVAAKLAALAETQGVAFARTRPPALDLLDSPDPETALRRWLGGD